MKPAKTATIFPILSAALSAISIPLSKLLLSHMPPAMMAAAATVLMVRDTIDPQHTHSHPQKSALPRPKERAFGETMRDYSSRLRFNSAIFSVTCPLCSGYQNHRIAASSAKPSAGTRVEIS